MIKANYLLTVYRDHSNAGRARKKWRWRMQAANGRIIGASTEGYSRIGHCLENLEQVTGFVIDETLEHVMLDRGGRLVDTSVSWKGKEVKARMLVPVTATCGGEPL